MFKKITFAFAGITAGMIALFTATSSAAGTSAHNHRSDCSIVAKADRQLCLRVQAQHAYGVVLGEGSWSAPGGRVIVHDITHQGLTRREMGDYLKGEARNYRDAVTHVTVNMDDIVKECGNTDGTWFVGFKDEDGKPGGRKLTQKVIGCA